MKSLIIYFILGLFLPDTAAVTHSMTLFHTTFSGLANFPECVIIGLVDDVQVTYYDSDVKTAVPKQDWASGLTGHGPQYWEMQTQRAHTHQHWLKVSIEEIKQRFNQTGGIHILQETYGCEWDDETDSFSDAFMQFGYDGEDFLVLDMKTMTWIAPKQQAVFTKQLWDKNRARLDGYKRYLTTECIEWVKEHVKYGRSFLMRTELPSVSLLQKSPSSPITCHATGFYPNSAVLFWRKDGEELFEDVEHGEILPNQDGSFQMSVELLKLPPEDWGKYECVFQLSGVKEEIITKLEKSVIRTNHEDNTKMIIGVIVAVVLTLLVVSAVAGFKIWKDNKSKCDGACENSSELEEKLNKEQES